jgi:hypothetical protein
VLSATFSVNVSVRCAVRRAPLCIRPQAGPSSPPLPLPVVSPRRLRRRGCVHGQVLTAPEPSGMVNQYAEDWRFFLTDTQSRESIFAFARQLAGKYGFSVYF